MDDLGLTGIDLAKNVFLSTNWFKASVFQTEKETMLISPALAGGCSVGGKIVTESKNPGNDFPRLYY